MQTKTYNVYTFDELSDEAKEKARDWYREYDDYPLLHDYMEEEARRLLEEAGFTNISIKNVLYSLSYCQGDGAMIEFSAKYDGDKLVEVQHAGHYYHERSTDVYYETQENELLDSKQLEEDVLVPLFKKLASAGYAYIEEEKEDERVAENIRINEYMFTEDGTLD